MPRKAPTSRASYKPSRSLDLAVREIGENLAKLTARLVGDDTLQTKGLIHEFGECRQQCQARYETSRKTDAELADAVRILVVKMEAVEDFKAKQEAVNAEIAAFRTKMETAENKLLGGWKAITLLISLITPIAGFLGWAVAKYVTSGAPH